MNSYQDVDSSDNQPLEIGELLRYLERQNFWYYYENKRSPIDSISTLKKIAIAVVANKEITNVTNNKSFDKFLDPVNRTEFDELSKKLKKLKLLSKKLPAPPRQVYPYYPYGNVSGEIEFNREHKETLNKSDSLHKAWQVEALSLLNENITRGFNKWGELQVEYQYSDLINSHLENKISELKKKRNTLCENVIDEAKPYVEFINACLKRNRDAVELLYFETKKERNSFKSLFYYKWLAYFWGPIEKCADFLKTLFDYTIGLRLLVERYDLERRFDVFAWMRVPSFSLWNSRPYFNFGIVRYPINAVTLFTAPINYIMRNIGRLLGMVIGLVAAIVIFPFTFGKSVRDYFSNKKEYNYEENIKTYTANIKNDNEAIYDKVFELIDRDNYEIVPYLILNLIKMYPDKIQDIFSRLEPIAFQNAEFNYILGKLYEAQGMNLQAAVCFNKIDPDYEDFIAVMLASAEWAYIAKDYELANGCLQKALAVDAVTDEDRAAQDECRRLLNPIAAVLSNKKLEFSQKNGWVVSTENSNPEKQRIKWLSGLQQKIYDNNCQSGFFSRETVSLSAYDANMTKLPKREMSVHAGVKAILDEIEKVRSQESTTAVACTQIQSIAHKQLAANKNGFFKTVLDCEIEFYKSIVSSTVMVRS